MRERKAREKPLASRVGARGSNFTTPRAARLKKERSSKAEYGDNL